MHAIIPVAGVGSRLRPHTYTLPKVLLHVAGRPILGHILESLVAQGVTSVTFIVGYMGDLVEEYVREGFDLAVTFVEQEEREGLGHAIWLARESLADEPVLIILGDTIFDVDLLPVFTAGVSSLGVKHVDDPRRFGVVEVDGTRVRKLVEKPDVPPSTLAIVGLYYIAHPRLLSEALEHLVANDLRTRGEYQLTDALQSMIDDGERFETFSVEGWFDCGKPETLLATNRYLLDRRSEGVRPADGVVVIEPSYVDPTATVENAIIGPHATIAEGAIVRDAIVRDSIIGARAEVTQTMLSGSIVGPDARLSGEPRVVNIGASSELSIG